MKKVRLITALFAAFLMMLAFTACGSTQQDATDTEDAVAEAATVTNDGFNLTIPAEYEDLLTVDAPENDADGILFKVSETASIEAAKAQEDADVDGAGWLFSIGRVDEQKLHEMLCGEMSGAQAFAKDADGNYYIYYHPTDVRLIRADNKEMEAVMDQWTALNEWSSSVPAAFIAENSSLTEESYGNTELDICLSQIAYQDNQNYTISTTEFGPLEPGDVDPAPYVEKLTRGVTYEFDDSAVAPDGEYVVLNCPDSDVRFDFFFAEGNTIRQVRGDDETFFKATFVDDSIKAVDVMQKWYHALAEK